MDEVHTLDFLVPMNLVKYLTPMIQFIKVTPDHGEGGKDKPAPK